VLTSASIVARLSAGTTLICDRYAFSGVAFSAAKGLLYEWCRGPEIGLPAPDLTLMLNVDPQVARERGGYGEERYEKEEMQVKVRSVFQKIAKEMGEKWINVDAGQKIADVQRTLWDHVENLSKGVEEPLQRLWDNIDSKVS
jgi:dTMP kinase